MTTPPPTKSLPDTHHYPRSAEPATAPAANGAPKVAAEGAPSAVRPDPHVITVTGIMPGLQVRMVGIPIADWLCRCGHHERAIGKTAVIALTTRVRVGECPHTTTPAAERRDAA